MPETPKTTQSNEDIVRLSPMEHVRKRPGMYIGGTDSDASHRMIYEIVDNAIDLAFAGQCDHIWVTLRDNNEVCIRDNGPGISVSVDQNGKSPLETAMTQIGMGNERIPISQDYRAGGHTRGMRIGFAAINALSEQLTVETAHDGFLWEQDYRKGKANNPPMQIRPLTPKDEAGLSFVFQPDFTIFEPHPFSYEQLAKRFREISYLVKGLAINLRDERRGKQTEVAFHSEAGLTDFIQHINADTAPLHEPIYEQFTVSVPRENYKPYAIKVDFAFQYADTPESKMISFVNTHELIDGGQHIQAIKSTIANVINSEDFYREEDDEEFTPSEATQGLTLVVHILHPSPSYMGATTREILVEPELYGAVCEAIFRACNQRLDTSRIEMWLVEKCKGDKG